jgi:hypothetical protein
MELTPQQIEHLFAFTKKKLVHWYDLQVELVDHLAARIEEEMSADPKLEFEKALDKVYKGFGIFGFAKIVQEKSQQLERASRKMWNKAMLNFFRWPKIIHLVFFIAFNWVLSNLFNTTILSIIFIILYLTASWVLFIRFNNIRKNATKNLMVLQFSPGSVSGGVIFYQIILMTGNYNWSPLIFTLLVTIGILYKIVSFQLYFKVAEEAKRMYPEAFA